MGMRIMVMTGMTLPAVSEADVERIRDAAGPGSDVVVVDSVGEAIEGAADIDVIMGRVSLPIFQAAPRLKWVHAAVSGMDEFLYREMCESDVILTGEKGLVGGHLADHAFALLLSLTRGVARAVRLGEQAWDHRMEFRSSNIELSEQVMGIVGLGGTGREVARRAVAFGMTCRAVDVAPLSPTPDVPLIQGMDAIGELLAASDVVAVCCPLTEETRGFFNAAVFAQMKPSAILVNVTRGAIVDNEALVAALQDGQIAGAALDVLDHEPLPPGHPLWSLPNVVTTPHTAGASQLRARRNIDRFCENLQRLRVGEDLIGVVDKRTGF